MRVLIALAVAALVHPFPAERLGAGKQPTTAAGLFADTRFVARSALVDYEVGSSCCPQATVGNVSVYLFERAGVTCTTLQPAKSVRFFSYTVEVDGKRLPLGRAPAAFIQQASFNIVGLTTGFQPGVSIVFTRIDTTRNGVWHGRVNVPRQSYNHKRYALAGTFAAHWCGTRAA